MLAPIYHPRKYNYHTSAGTCINQLALDLSAKLFLAVCNHFSAHDLLLYIIQVHIVLPSISSSWYTKYLEHFFCNENSHSCFINIIILILLQLAQFMPKELSIPLVNGKGRVRDPLLRVPWIHGFVLHGLCVHILSDEFHSFRLSKIYELGQHEKFKIVEDPRVKRVIPEHDGNEGREWIIYVKEIYIFLKSAVHDFHYFLNCLFECLSQW